MESRNRRLPERRLPTHRELFEAFEDVPPDPRTGYPAGYVSFSVELDARISVTKCPARWAPGASRQTAGRKGNLLRN